MFSIKKFSFKCILMRIMLTCIILSVVMTAMAKKANIFLAKAGNKEIFLLKTDNKFGKD